MTRGSAVHPGLFRSVRVKPIPFFSGAQCVAGLLMSNVGRLLLGYHGEGRINRTGDAGWGGDGHGSNCKGDDADDAGAGRNGEETASRRIYGRVCGWRAMHAVSLNHG